MVSSIKSTQSLTPSSSTKPLQATAPVAANSAPPVYGTDTLKTAKISEGERQYQIAQAWDPNNPKGMTGAQANQAITAAYTWLDGRLSSYLGDPPVANWTTFGKYASREAGTQIQRFEALEGAMEQGSIKNALGLLADFLDHRDSLERQSRLLNKVSKGPVDYVNNVELMRDSTVAGNAAIMHNIGPAFNAFLTAEEKGLDGIQAIKDAGYGKAPLDPQGFLLQAFEGYKKANGLTQRLKSETLTDEQRQALVTERQDVTFQANLLVGIQEQMYSLQTPETFGNPKVAELMKAFTPTMQLADSVGTMPLLPNGGNWANFADRMGFLEVPNANQAGSFTIPDVNGKVHYYIVNPDAKARQGTILDYMASNMGEEKSRQLIQGGPAKYSNIYDSAANAVKSVWGWVKDKVGLGSSKPAVLEEDKLQGLVWGAVVEAKPVSPPAPKRK